MKLLNETTKYLSSVFSLRNNVAALLLFTAYTFIAFYILPEGVSKTFSLWSYKTGLGFLAGLGGVYLILHKGRGRTSADKGLGGLSLGLLVILLLALLPISNYLLANRETISFMRSTAFFAFLAGLGGVYVILHKGRGGTSADKAPGSFDFGLLVILLLPLTPISKYILLNQDTLSLLDSTAFFMCCLALAILVIFVVPSSLKQLIRPSVSVVLAASLMYTYFNMPTLTADQKWYMIGDFPVQIAAFVAAFVILRVLYETRRSFLYPFLVMYLATDMTLAFVSGEGLDRITDSSGPSDFPAAAELSDASFQTTPDIYLLSYDGYADNTTMRQYGIDNRAQESFLRASGFKIYHDTYSLGRFTTTSMSQVLNMAHSDTFEHPLRVLAGDSSVVRILRANGYGTFAVPHWPYYDETDVTVQREAQFSILIRAIAEGQFRFNVGEIDQAELIQAKRGVFRRDGESPKFLYSHTGPGHSQNSGACRPDEIDLYRERLAAANREMIDDVRAIKAASREAVIIVHGDHGPQLTGDCRGMQDYEMHEITRLHLQDNFGAFLAIKWPDECAVCDQSYDIKIIQDIFPVVFAALSGDSSILDHRVEPRSESSISGTYVNDGMIVGGRDDGGPLFLSSEP